MKQKMSADTIYIFNIFTIGEIRAIFSNLADLRCKLNDHCREISDILLIFFAKIVSLVHTFDLWIYLINCRVTVWYRLMYKGQGKWRILKFCEKLNFFVLQFQIWKKKFRKWLQGEGCEEGEEARSPCPQETEGQEAEVQTQTICQEHPIKHILGID